MQYTVAENAAITKAVPNDVMQNALSYGNSDTFKVIRRNGQVTHFDASKIETAMTKAFFDVEGAGARDSSRIHERVKMLTATVEACLFKRVPTGGVIHIDDIKNQIKLVQECHSISREKYAKVETSLALKIYKHIKTVLIILSMF